MVLLVEKCDTNGTIFFNGIETKIYPSIGKRSELIILGSLLSSKSVVFWRAVANIGSSRKSNHQIKR